MLSLSLNGTTATVTEHWSGLAAKFGDAAYPHVQHIHIGAMGTCPTTSADKNGDGVISTTEGAASYGGIGATLSVSGDTSPGGGDEHQDRTRRPEHRLLADAHPGHRHHRVDPGRHRRDRRPRARPGDPEQAGPGREERSGPLIAAGGHVTGALRCTQRLAHRSPDGCRLHRWAGEPRDLRTRWRAPRARWDRRRARAQALDRDRRPRKLIRCLIVRRGRRPEASAVRAGCTSPP